MSDGVGDDTRDGPILETPPRADVPAPPRRPIPRIFAGIDLNHLGWVAGLPDPRAVRFSARFPVRTSGGLSRNFTPGRPRVQNQRSWGSCTGQSVATMVEVQLAGKGRALDVSRAFSYYVGRARRGWQDRDTGAVIRDVIDGLAEFGIPSETLWPYRDETILARPSDLGLGDPWEQAKAHRLSGRLEIRNSDEGKAAIDSGRAFVGGLTLLESFDDVRRTGKFPKPEGTELGGHAVCAVGYDDDVPFDWCSQGAFLFTQSWGDEYGVPHPAAAREGRFYFWVPYAAINNRGIFGDGHTVDVVE